MTAFEHGYNSCHKYFYWKCFFVFSKLSSGFIGCVVPCVGMSSQLSIYISLIRHWIRSLIRTVAILQASAIFMIASYFSSALWYKDLIKVVKIADNRCDLLNYKSALWDSSVDEQKLKQQCFCNLFQLLCVPSSVNHRCLAPFE